MKWQRIIFAVLVAGVLAVGVVACGGSSSSGSGGSGSNADDKISAETQAYLDDAMPRLKKIVSAFRDGDYDKAGKLWKSIGDIPGSTTADSVVSDAYLEYANNVRYYIIDDGSATLKDVEESQAKAEETIASYQ